ncbi:MAG: glycosyltransferase family 4 protein, partial [Rubrivivax sp.]|nr:glycosyltransferase family 4 protein [Rubrivivax sp.]MDP3612539.1 glycosyltransferase family 4 protein [Rubrivivax sp.]
MKVLLVIHGLSAGGAERAMSELATFLAGRGWGVVLTTISGTVEPDFYPLDPSVRRVRLANPAPASGTFGKISANLQRIRALRELLAHERPHVVLSFLETTNVLCLLAVRGLRVPIVVAERTDPAQHTTVPAPWRLARQVLYRRASMVVAQTEAAGAWLRAQCHCAVTILANALRPLPPASAAREPLLLSVGRLDPAKGFDLLLEAFATVHRDFPGWRLAIVGVGPLAGNLRTRAATLGIEDRVEWAGQRSDVEAWYARAAIVAQASRFEGFPNVVLEAMGMGAAVISTDCRSGPRELITHGHDGWLVPVEDVPSLAAALRMLMSDAVLRRRLGAAAMAVRNRFEAGRMLGSWEQILAAASASAKT